MKPTTILLVEDARDQVHIMKAYILADLPHAQILTCDSVKDAMEIIAKEPPQLLVLDLTLKDGSGEDVLAHVRQTASIPVLVVTGNKSDEVLTRIFDFGADDYVLKPVDELIFQSKVRSLLSARYVSPLRFLGQGDGIGRLKLKADLQISYLDEYRATVISSCNILPGGTFKVTLKDYTFECKVIQSQQVGGDHHMTCEVITRTIKDRPAFRKYLLERNFELHKKEEAA